MARKRNTESLSIDGVRFAVIGADEMPNMEPDQYLALAERAWFALRGQIARRKADTFKANVDATEAVMKDTVWPQARALGIDEDSPVFVALVAMARAGVEKAGGTWQESDGRTVSVTCAEIFESIDGE
jgi:hypothetical protein